MSNSNITKEEFAVFRMFATGAKSHLARTALVEGVKMDVSREDIQELAMNTPMCPYQGTQLTFGNRRGDTLPKNSPVVSRKDWSKPYTIDNLEIVSQREHESRKIRAFGFIRSPTKSGKERKLSSKPLPDKFVPHPDEGRQVLVKDVSAEQNTGEEREVYSPWVEKVNAIIENNVKNMIIELTPYIAKRRGE